MAKQSYFTTSQSCFTTVFDQSIPHAKTHVQQQFTNTHVSNYLQTAAVNTI